MSKDAKKYWDMTKAELAAATKEFDREFIADKARPMTSAERDQEQRARLRGRQRRLVSKPQAVGSRTSAQARRRGGKRLS